MKLNREALAHYIDSKWNLKLADVGKAEFELIGDDIEEMSVEMNPDTSQVKNILGQSRTVDNGFAPTMSADPWYADPDKKIYTKLRDIALEQKKGDERKTLMLEVVVEDTSSSTHLAYVREVKVTPTSYGGGTEGFNIPFNVEFDGGWIKGTVTAESVKNGAPVFTEASAALTD
jgi:hypothetical protein